MPAAYRERYVTSQDGLRLYFRDYGNPSSPRLPLICLTGITRNSADFADLAKTYSEAGNKDDGGELGWVTQNGKTAIRSDLWDTIAKLQPGQHTDVIATTDGFYYIVQVEDRKQSAMTPLEDVRAQIEQTVINEESQVRQQQWLDSLRAKAFIKMFL